MHTLARLFVIAASLSIVTTMSQAQDSSLATIRELVMQEPTARAVVMEVQEALAELGYDSGPADGLLGRRTRTALMQWREDTNYEVAAVWIQTTEEAASNDSGWQCTTIEAATSHDGPAAIDRGTRLRNITVSVTSDGPQYLAASSDEGMIEIPPPRDDCPEGAVFM